jgi:hypothetical protein
VEQAYNLNEKRWTYEIAEQLSKFQIKNLQNTAIF